MQEGFETPPAAALDAFTLHRPWLYLLFSYSMGPEQTNVLMLSKLLSARGLALMTIP